jgi:hypothetical protein
VVVSGEEREHGSQEENNPSSPTHNTHTLSHTQHTFLFPGPDDGAGFPGILAHPLLAQREGITATVAVVDVSSAAE